MTEITTRNFLRLGGAMVRLVPSSRSFHSRGLLNKFVAFIVVAILSLGWLRIVLLEERESAATSPVQVQLEGFALSSSSSKQTSPGRYPTLKCDAYGGPAEEAAQEMVYWQGRLWKNNQNGGTFFYFQPFQFLFNNDCFNVLHRHSQRRALCQSLS
jgi:hypothetical protein